MESTWRQNYFAIADAKGVKRLLPTTMHLFPFVGVGQPVASAWMLQKVYIAREKVCSIGQK
jgi:hypothetical protein